VFANSVDAVRGVTSRVLGIDPGLTRCGFAVIDGRGPNNATAVSMGVIRTSASDPLPQRLGELRTEFTALIAEFKPDVVAVEQVFFQNNVRTAMSVGQASGLALAEAALAGCCSTRLTRSKMPLPDGAAPGKNRCREWCNSGSGCRNYPRQPMPLTQQPLRSATWLCRQSGVKFVI
jgi:hypothetical protein